MIFLPLKIYHVPNMSISYYKKGGKPINLMVNGKFAYFKK